MDDLLQRLHGALPWLSLLGGVVHAPAWGTQSLRGALFEGDRTLDSGAVGALMSGPLQVGPCGDSSFQQLAAGLLVAAYGFQDLDHAWICTCL